MNRLILFVVCSVILISMSGCKSISGLPKDRNVPPFEFKTVVEGLDTDSGYVFYYDESRRGIESMVKLPWERSWNSNEWNNLIGISVYDTSGSMNDHCSFVIHFYVDGYLENRVTNYQTSSNMAGIEMYWPDFSEYERR